MSEIGLGGISPALKMYIANRPVGARYTALAAYEPLLPDELHTIVANNSNHWRKAFNVFAKVLWQLNWCTSHQCTAKTWQNYRDSYLLQAHSREAMLFTPPVFSKAAETCSEENVVHWVVGKTYASTLMLPPLTWVDTQFAINESHRVIVSPYVDYRQLTNARIEQFDMLYRGLTC